MSGTLIVLVLLAHLSAIPVLAADKTSATTFENRPCPKVSTNVNIKCGVVRVPENYEIAGGRQIELNVLVLKATRTNKKRIAQYDLEGGPGFDATYFLNFYATEGTPYRASRDIVLADMRGTGQSNPLRCSAIEALERSDTSAPMYPPELVAECAGKISTNADPRFYSTAAASRDIDRVRQALGYEQLDINAVSYGTTLALRYIADFPERVRSAVLVGTLPAERAPPRHHAAAADRVLALLIDDCVHDKRCSASFPDADADLKRSLDRLAEPDAPLSRGVFMEKLRGLMYMPLDARRIPFLLHQAAAGDFSSLLKPKSSERPFADGLYLSITCTETFARIDLGAAISEAEQTHFGAYRLMRQAEACKHWPSGVLDPELMKVDVLRTPVLFLAGEMDPVTPPDWAVQVARRFPNSRVKIIRNGVMCSMA